MKATLVDSMPPGSWIYEIKLDGYRALALRGGNQTRILSRNQKDLGKKFQIIADSIAGLKVQDAIIDYAASGIINDRVLNTECSDRAFYFREFAAQIFFVSGEDSGLITVAQRYGTVTVELNFVDPISRTDRFDQHRLHRRHEGGDGRTRYSAGGFRTVTWLTAYRPF
jgi:hypothetical protein